MLSHFITQSSLVNHGISLNYLIVLLNRISDINKYFWYQYTIIQIKKNYDIIKSHLWYHLFEFMICNCCFCQRSRAWVRGRAAWWAAPCSPSPARISTRRTHPRAWWSADSTVRSRRSRTNRSCASRRRSPKTPRRYTQVRVLGPAYVDLASRQN